MKVDNVLPAGFQELQGADIYNHGHLPIAAAYCRRLGLIQLVNDMVGSQMELQPGLIVQAMVLDTLSGRTPLYRLKDFLAEQDTELLLGTAVCSDDFHDTNLGRSLDAIFESGPSKIIAALGVRATHEFALDTASVSYDTTSTSVWGDYHGCESEDFDKGPCITHGHSKDNQPQLKQFMTELLCVDRGVPIFSSTLDGNSSDKKSNNKMLSEISALMARHGLGPGAFIYVADSAAVTQKNLDEVGENLFVSRLPATYSECQRLIEEAVDAHQWIDLGPLVQIPTKSSRQCAIYKTFETSVTLYNKSYRAVVVYSSSHDKRRQKKLEKTIVQSSKSITDQLAQFPSQYYCEADAKAAAQKAEQLSNNLHVVSASVRTFEVRKPGRPPADRQAPTTQRYAITCEVRENAEAVARETQLAGCFVLITNVPCDGTMEMDSKRLLLTYKGQYGVENDFAFLKDPLVVNDIFLKKPHRIDALGMVLVISLMIYRLMERTMRKRLQKSKTELVGWVNRKTDKPTSFMMTTAMVGISVMSLQGKRILLHKPNSRQTDYLTALGLTSMVFLDPACKCLALITENRVHNGC